MTTWRRESEALRIAFSPNLGFVVNDPEVERLVRDAADVLAELSSASRQEVDPGFADPVEAFHVLWFAGAVKVTEAYGPEAPNRVDPGLRRAVELGREMTASDFLDATAVRMDLGVRMGRFHRTYDLLLTPSIKNLRYSDASIHITNIDSIDIRWVPVNAKMPDRRSSKRVVRSARPGPGILTGQGQTGHPHSALRAWSRCQPVVAHRHAAGGHF